MRSLYALAYITMNASVYFYTLIFYYLVIIFVVWMLLVVVAQAGGVALTTAIHKDLSVPINLISSLIAIGVCAYKRPYKFSRKDIEQQSLFLTMFLLIILLMGLPLFGLMFLLTFNA